MTELFWLYAVAGKDAWCSNTIGIYVYTIMPRTCTHDMVDGAVANASCCCVDLFFCGDQCEFKREARLG